MHPDIALGLNAFPDLKLSSLPHHVERRISPTIAPKPLQAPHNPGVIGSGRPSSTALTEASSERGAESRAASIGILKNASTLSRAYPNLSPVDGSLLYKTGDSSIIRPQDPTQGFLQSPVASMSTAATFSPYNSPASMPRAGIPDHTRPSRPKDTITDPLTTINGIQRWRKTSPNNSKDPENVKTAWDNLSRGQYDANADTAAGRGMDSRKELDPGSHSNLTPGSSNASPELPTPQNQGSQSPQLQPRQEDDAAIRERDGLADAILLYLMARERVLTLQEQKVRLFILCLYVEVA